MIKINDGYTHSTLEGTNLLQIGREGKGRGGEGRGGEGRGELGVESNKHHICSQERGARGA